MNPEVLEEVLRCDKLPSLPAVAARVIELTGTKDVSMVRLAETIQHDQALTAKILRTVNSSIFSLRRKCASINQAIVMLGLNSVKTLALGFSLVSAIEKAAGAGQKRPGFDMADHWRRSLTTAAAARSIANIAGLPSPEECFLGGLLQDVGMVALHLAMGDEYDRIVAQARGEHAAVTRLELVALGTQHADVGAMLASRWRLPDELVMPIKYHERPTAAPLAQQPVCRAVWLGNTACEVLLGADPAGAMRRFHRQCKRWFAIGTAEADEILLAVSAQAREMATLLRVPILPAADAASMIARARARLAGLDVVDGPLPTTDALDFERCELVDELTGVSSRRKFDQTIIAAFEQAREVEGSLALALVDIEGIESLSKNHGQDLCDTVLIVVAARLERAFSPARPLTCRFDASRFAVLMQKADPATASRLALAASELVRHSPIEIAAAQRGSPVNVTVGLNIGLAVLERGEASVYTDAADFVAGAEASLEAAKREASAMPTPAGAALKAA
ncbi:MAG: HDOD domain-containing protein [Phycisphaerales bacterium]